MSVTIKTIPKLLSLLAADFTLISTGRAASVALFGGYPVAEGQALVIPRRHVASLFDLPPEEFADAWDFGDAGACRADQALPSGFLQRGHQRRPRRRADGLAGAQPQYSSFDRTTTPALCFADLCAI
ncbi:MAG: hypothetical protein RIS76_3962 [Verrucomicrobiota bacterium]|jgi:hypothetical protein